MGVSCDISLSEIFRVSDKWLFSNLSDIDLLESLWPHFKLPTYVPACFTHNCTLLDRAIPVFLAINHWNTFCPLIQQDLEPCWMSEN